MTGFTKNKLSDLAFAHKVHKAMRVLELNGIVSVSVVREAFASMVKQAHPDVSDDVAKEVNLMQLRAAKDLLVKHLENGNA